MDAEQKMKAVLAEFPVVVVQPVQWGEQDPLGHVNHVTYFRWYESARIAYFLKVGLMDMHKNEHIGPILASVANDYRRQISYPDTVHIGVRITRIGRTSMDMEHKILSQNDTPSPPRAPRHSWSSITRPTSPTPSPPASATRSRPSRGGRSEAEPARRSSLLLASSAPELYELPPATRRPFRGMVLLPRHPKPCTRLVEDMNLCG